MKLGPVHATEKDIIDLSQQPQFRKATVNMLVALAAAKKLCQDIMLPEKTGIILNSEQGELPATLDFLEGLAKESVARPILFQNSLHHSTLGFLTIQLNLRGPGFCTSVPPSTNENTVDMVETLAINLVKTKRCPQCLIIQVDSTWSEHPFKEFKNHSPRSTATAWLV